MKLSNWLFLSLSLFLLACGSGESGSTDTSKKKENPKKQLKSIKKERTALFVDESKTADAETLKDYCLQLEKFCRSFPEHEKTPAMLYEAGSIRGNQLQQYEQAIYNYQQVFKKYPEHDKAPDALFATAFIYDNIGANYEKAKEHYIQFLEDYPEHELKASAVASLRNLGKSPEEMMEEIQKENSK